MQPNLFLDIRNVSAYRGDNAVFHNLNLQIKPDESVAILGPNGSGKSTLLKLLTREIYPVVLSDSYVKINGSETVNVRELYQQLGFVSQDLQERYTPYSTAFEIIASGLFGAIGAHEHLHLTEEQRIVVNHALTASGLAAEKQRMFQHLSTGEKRRLLMARALIHEPEILILDEPINSLDVSAAFNILAMMRKHIQSGKSIILTTHHVQEIIPEIERVILLQKGKIIADGHKASVLTEENMQKLYGVPLEVVERNGFYQFYPAP